MERAAAPSRAKPSQAGRAPSPAGAAELARSPHRSLAAGAGAGVLGAPAFLRGLGPRGLPASLGRWWRQWLACASAEKREASVAGATKLGLPSGLKAPWGQRGLLPAPF